MAQLIQETAPNAIEHKLPTTGTVPNASAKRKAETSYPTSNKVSKHALPRSSIQQLNSWLASHLNHPFPNSHETLELLAKTGLTHQQLSHWLEKARKKMRGVNGSWECGAAVLGEKSAVGRVSLSPEKGEKAEEAARQVNGENRGAGDAVQMEGLKGSIVEDVVKVAGGSCAMKLGTEAAQKKTGIQAPKVVIKDAKVVNGGVEMKRSSLEAVKEVVKIQDAVTVETKPAARKISVEAIQEDARKKVKDVDSHFVMKEGSIMFVSKSDSGKKPQLTMNEYLAAKKAAEKAAEAARIAARHVSTSTGLRLPVGFVPKKDSILAAAEPVMIPPKEAPKPKSSEKAESKSTVGTEPRIEKAKVVKVPNEAATISPKAASKPEPSEQAEPKKTASAEPRVEKVNVAKILDKATAVPSNAAPKPSEKPEPETVSVQPRVEKENVAKIPPKEPFKPKPSEKPESKTAGVELKILNKTTIEHMSSYPRPPQNTAATAEPKPSVGIEQSLQNGAGVTSIEPSTKTAPVQTQPETPHVPTVGLSDSVIEYLHEWLVAHVDNPFPTKAEKALFISHLGLHPVHDSRKIDGWFSRQRRKLRDGKFGQQQPSKQASTTDEPSNNDPPKAVIPAADKLAWVSEPQGPSCTDVDRYLYEWMSRDENLGMYSPNIETRLQMQAESGIEIRRIESWFYRLRKRMKKQAKAEGVELEALQKVMSGILVKERMKRAGLLPESEDEEASEEEPKDEPEVEETFSPDESETSMEDSNRNPARVSGLDILSDLATYHRELPPAITSAAKLLVTGLSNIKAINEEGGTVVSEESDSESAQGFESTLCPSMIPRRPESPSLCDFYGSL